jgi:hypothetical protein
VAAKTAMHALIASLQGLAIDNAPTPPAGPPAAATAAAGNGGTP